jgi:hypothetical protein
MITSDDKFNRNPFNSDGIKTCLSLEPLLFSPCNILYAQKWCPHFHTPNKQVIQPNFQSLTYLCKTMCFKTKPTTLRKFKYPSVQRVQKTSGNTNQSLCTSPTFWPALGEMIFPFSPPPPNDWSVFFPLGFPTKNFTRFSLPSCMLLYPPISSCYIFLLGQNNLLSCLYCNRTETTLILSAFTDKVERHCHFRASGKNFTTRRQVLQHFSDTRQVSLYNNKNNKINLFII